MDYKDSLIVRITDKLIRCVFPKKCTLCGKIIPLNEEYCKCSNKSSIKISDAFCHHCGHNEFDCICSLSNTVYLPEIAAVYIYGGQIKADILNLKFNNEKRLAKKLGFMLAERVAIAYCDIDFDLVTFVPMSDESKNIRTYNQSQLLADQVGKLLFYPVEEVFKKTRQTKSQHKLKGKERLVNLKDSIKLINPESVKGKNILICDDVKTTGATLSQCVELLEKAGAEKVCCVCVAVSNFRKIK